MLCPADERGGNMAKELNERVNDGTEKLNTEKAGKFSRFLKFADRYKGLMPVIVCNTCSSCSGNDRNYQLQHGI